MWNLKYNTSEIIYETETDSQTQRTDWWLPQGRGEWGREGLGVWDYQTQTTIYRMDKQQGYIVQHREIQPLFCNNFKWSLIYKNIESLCCTPETNIIL